MKAEGHWVCPRAQAPTARKEESKSVAGMVRGRKGEMQVTPRSLYRHCQGSQGPLPILFGATVELRKDKQKEPHLAQGVPGFDCPFFLPAVSSLH